MAMETLEEEVSLQEALQQIEDWDTDLAALLGLEDVEASSRKRRCGRPNAKRERLDLQQQLDDLARQVASLSASSSPSRDADALWHDIAARQREQRFAVEVENNKLRRVLEDEYKSATRLSALVNKAHSIGTALGSSRDARVDQYKGPKVDPADHLARLDEVAQEAQTVFSSGRFADHAGRDFRDAEFKNFGQEGLLIELSVSWVLPFSVESVVDALWFQTTRMPRKERTTSFKDIYTAERTLVSRFVSEAKVLGTIDADHIQPVGWSTHGQIATRYEPPTPSGSVLLVSHLDVKNFQEDGKCRSIMKGKGFLLVEPLKTEEANTSSAPICRVKWCRHVQGCAPDDSVDAQSEYARWSHSLTSKTMRAKWWSSIELHLQAIENTLFDAVQGLQPLANLSCAAMCVGKASDEATV